RYQLDGARRDPAEEQLGGRDRLARAAVGHRTVDDEMVRAGGEQHPSERRAGLGLHHVLMVVLMVHASSASNPNAFGDRTPSARHAGQHASAAAWAPARRPLRRRTKATPAAATASSAIVVGPVALLIAARATEPKR